MDRTKTNSVTLITESEKMRKILADVRKIADSDEPVLIMGETGVGKEVLADYIHNMSKRARRSFIKISLSAMPYELLESELFGHEKGSFTGAVSEKKGLFEMADKGSIFLDDIDDVPLQFQTKLLRVLENGELLRIGGTKPIKLDIRMIVASKFDIKTLVERKILRADLFYRINVIPVNIPPLRERREDIEPLINYFIKNFEPNRAINFTPEAIGALTSHYWSGNVRELKNMMRRILLFASSEITLNDLPSEIINGSYAEEHWRGCEKCNVNRKMYLNQTINCLEFNLVKKALQDSNGNQTQAADKLGLKLSTFRDKMLKYNLK